MTDGSRPQATTEQRAASLADVRVEIDSVDDRIHSLLMRRAELVESVRGPGGGYRLAKATSDIRVLDVLGAVDETVDAMHKGAGASGGSSGSRAQSMTNRLWEGLSANVYVYLHQTRLSDVVTNGLAPCPAVPSLFDIVDE